MSCWRQYQCRPIQIVFICSISRVFKPTPIPSDLPFWKQLHLILTLLFFFRRLHNALCPSMHVYVWNWRFQHTHINIYNTKCLFIPAISQWHPGFTGVTSKKIGLLRKNIDWKHIVELLKIKTGNNKSIAPPALLCWFSWASIPKPIRHFLPYFGFSPFLVIYSKFLTSPLFSQKWYIFRLDHFGKT